MVKRYARPKMWEETLKNFKLKQSRMNLDLKSIGVRRKMPLTRILHIASMKPIYLDSEDIRKISRRKKFEI